jgi:hypothetical protein
MPLSGSGTHCRGRRRHWTGLLPGATSQGQLAHRSALALADRLATPATKFPGGHAGFVTHPVKCAQVLHQQLTHPT